MSSSDPKVKVGLLCPIQQLGPYWDRSSALPRVGVEPRHRGGSLWLDAKHANSLGHRGPLPVFMMTKVVIHGPMGPLCLFIVRELIPDLRSRDVEWKSQQSGWVNVPVSQYTSEFSGYIHLHKNTYAYIQWHLAKESESMPLGKRLKSNILKKKQRTD